MNKLEEKMHYQICNDNGLSENDSTETCAKNCTTIAIEFAIGYNAWYNKLTPTQKCTVHAPAGSGCSTGLYEKDDEKLMQSYIKTLS